MAVFDATEDVVVQGRLVLRGAVGNRLAGALWDVTENVISTLTIFPIGWTDWRESTAYATPLPSAGTSTFLGLYGGTFGTNQPSIQTGDFKTTTITRVARAMIKLPERYVGGSTVQIRLGAGMLTTVADGSCTVAIAAYRIGKDYSIGSQICPTAAQSINSLTASNKTFTITAATLNPGDVLDVQITIAGVDTATGSVVNGAIFGADLLCNIQG